MEVPSYARPTIASARRNRTSPQQNTDATPKKSTFRSPQRDEKTLARLFYPSYERSTKASFSRSRPGRFRLLDLPAELRARIYYYYCGLGGVQMLRFHIKSPLLKNRRLLTLMRLNQKIRGEAEHLFFISRLALDMTGYHGRVIKRLAKWLASLSPSQREILMENRQVTLYFIPKHRSQLWYDIAQSGSVANPFGYVGFGTEVLLAHLWDQERARKGIDRSALAQWRVYWTNSASLVWTDGPPPRKEGFEWNESGTIWKGRSTETLPDDLVSAVASVLEVVRRYRPDR